MTHFNISHVGYVMATNDTPTAADAELPHPQPLAAQLQHSLASAVAPDANDQPTDAKQAPPPPAAQQLPSGHQRSVQAPPQLQAQPPAAQLLLLQLPTDLLAGRLWALLPGRDRRRLRMACRAAASLATEQLMAHPTVGVGGWVCGATHGEARLCGVCHQACRLCCEQGCGCSMTMCMRRSP